MSTQARLAFAPAALAALLILPADSDAQFPFTDAATGQFYRIEPEMTAARTFSEVRIERAAPHALAPPAPVAPLPLPLPLAALTGQIVELPRHQRIYFAGLDSGGAVHLLEVDLVGRLIRKVPPRLGSGPAYAVSALAAPDGSKLYVNWFSSGAMAATDIYDGASLGWLGDTVEFWADERALGFEHEPPYLWALVSDGRPALVHTGSDRVERTFDYQRWLGPAPGAVADAWNDLLLLRLDVGHDRFQVVDVVSGELGPPLDLEGYRQALPRLALDGRFLALIDIERRAPRRGWRNPAAVAVGSGAVYDLRDGGKVDDFFLITPLELPAWAVGTLGDPTAPGRLHIYVPGDDERLELGVPACERRTPVGDAVDADLEARWESTGIYQYRLAVAASSPAAVGGLAIRAGREAERTSKPDGWGVDLIDGDRWVRWTNGLGPASDDVGPGGERDGFVIAARPDTRPAIVEYRVQAALGLPRGCESEKRFLDNSARGHTIGPERVTTDDPRKLARRLGELVERACELGWVSAPDCTGLVAAAEALGSRESERAAAIERFRAALSEAQANGPAAALLDDALAAVASAVER